MIFVSHDFDDRSDFDNVTDALDAAGLKHFDPRGMAPGSSLRDKLREAIRTCSGCIFIATSNSIASGWCQAEIGAFWGVGKPVCTLVPDKSVTDDDMPPQLKGDLWTTRMTSILAAATEFDALDGQSVAVPKVSDLDIAEFLRLIRQELASAGPDPRALLERVREIAELKLGLVETDEGQPRRLKEALQGLIGLDYSHIDAIAQDVFPWVGSVEDAFGRWTAYSVGNESGPGREVYKDGCLLLTARGGRIAAAGAASWVGGFFSSPGISEWSAFAGRVQLFGIKSVI